MQSLQAVLFDIVTLPTWAIYRVQQRLIGPHLAYLGLSQKIAQWTGVLGIYRRRAVLRRAVQCGDDLSIGPGTLLTQSTVSLGNHVYIGSYCNVGNVEIGDGTLLADQVHIITGYHGIDRLDIPIKDQPTTQRRIKIGADSWIGSGAVVLADVGSHCVIGAGSVVTKPIADYAIAVGNPAKPIGDRRERAARSADDRADDRADSRAQ